MVATMDAASGDALQALRAQLSAALWTCGQLPAGTVATQALVQHMLQVAAHLLAPPPFDPASWPHMAPPAAAAPPPPTCTSPSPPPSAAASTRTWLQQQRRKLQASRAVRWARRREAAAQPRQQQQQAAQEAPAQSRQQEPQQQEPLQQQQPAAAGTHTWPRRSRKLHAWKACAAWQSRKRDHAGAPGLPQHEEEAQQLAGEQGKAGAPAGSGAACGAGSPGRCEPSSASSSSSSGGDEDDRQEPSTASSSSSSSGRTGARDATAALPAQPHPVPRPYGPVSFFSAWEAELCEEFGLPAHQASVLCACVRGLRSSHAHVRAAAAHKLLGLTAEEAQPAAVAGALTATGGIPLLMALLASGDGGSGQQLGGDEDEDGGGGDDGDGVRCAAAACLCNVAWYPRPAADILAAGGVPALVAMLWDGEDGCRLEAALALTALTASLDEAVCAAVAAVGGIPRLACLLGTGGGSGDSSSSSSDEASNGDGGDRDEGGQERGCDGSKDRDGVGEHGSSGDEHGGSPRQDASSSSPRQASLGQDIPRQASTAGSDCSCAASAGAREHSCSSNASADELAAAACRVLGHLAAGSASRRATIAATGSVLPALVALAGSTDGHCREAALGALQHLLADEQGLEAPSSCRDGSDSTSAAAAGGTPAWGSLSAGIIRGVVAAGGVQGVLEGLACSDSSGSGASVRAATELLRQVAGPACPSVAVRCEDSPKPPAA